MSHPAIKSFQTDSALRYELNPRAAAYAERHGVPIELSSGRKPSVLFTATPPGKHGNFPPQCYSRIIRHGDWAKRLAQPHATEPNKFTSDVYWPS